MRGKTIISVLLILMASSCITQEKCSKRFPPQEKDSLNYREISKDTMMHINADNSMAQYLVECEKTSEGYKAVITQLLTQKPGEYMQTPVSTIDSNGIMTTQAHTPEREIHWQVKEFHYAAVKSQVYVQITNILIWWQKWLMVIGSITLVAVITIVIYRLIKRRFKLFI